MFNLVDNVNFSSRKLMSITGSTTLGNLKKTNAAVAIRALYNFVLPHFIRG